MDEEEFEAILCIAKSLQPLFVDILLGRGRPQAGRFFRLPVLKVLFASVPGRIKAVEKSP